MVDAHADADAEGVGLAAVVVPVAGAPAASASVDNCASVLGAAAAAVAEEERWKPRSAGRFALIDCRLERRGATSNDRRDSGGILTLLPSSLGWCAMNGRLTLGAASLAEAKRVGRRPLVDARGAECGESVPSSVAFVWDRNELRKDTWSGIVTRFGERG